MTARPPLAHLALRIALLAAAIVLPAEVAAAQLAANQTNGFGNGRLITFTYLQNFDCVDQPTLDLDFNGIPAQSDPAEMQTPICQAVTEPTQDPTGGDIKHTAHLYVFLPMFSVDNDQNPNDAIPCPVQPRPNELCGPALGAKLIQVFGALPEAWKAKVNPGITTQCPDPHPGAAPGTCTMHASTVDLSVTLAALGAAPTPPAAPIFVPTPNHSHVVDNSRVNTEPIWWEVRPVLIMDQSDWPAADGSSGITSSKAMDDAEQSAEAPLESAVVGVQSPSACRAGIRSRPVAWRSQRTSSLVKKRHEPRGTPSAVSRADAPSASLLDL